MQAGLGRLPTYRVHHVGSGGRLSVGETFFAQDDAGAVEQARPRLIRSQAAELWSGGRLVGRFSKTHAFTVGG